MDQTDKPTPERRRERWHVGKEVPLAFLVAMIVQTGVFVWWFSEKSTRLELKLDWAIETLKDYRAERYTKDDARRDQALVTQMVEMLRQADEEQRRRITNCESASKGDRK